MREAHSKALAPEIGGKSLVGRHLPDTRRLKTKPLQTERFKEMRAAVDTGLMKTCPECAEDVREGARVCRFCAHRFDDGGDHQPREPRAARGSLVWKIALGVVLGLFLTAGMALAATTFYTSKKNEGRSEDGVAKARATSVASRRGMRSGTERRLHAMRQHDVSKGDNSLADAGVSLGPGKGKVVVQDTAGAIEGLYPGGAGRYTVVAHSKTGNRFTVTKDENATLTRTEPLPTDAQREASGRTPRLAASPSSIA